MKFEPKCYCVAALFRSININDMFEQTKIGARLWGRGKTMRILGGGGGGE